jgi:hypothetical protein
MADREMTAQFCLESLKGRYHSEDLGIDGSMDLIIIGWEGLDWINLA